MKGGNYEKEVSDGKWVGIGGRLGVEVGREIGWVGGERGR